MLTKCTCGKCGKGYEAEVQSRHRLMCGDSTDPAAVLILMDGNKAALCFTSPPYNVGNNSLGGNKSMTDSKYLNDNDDKPSEEYLEFLRKFTAIALQAAQTVAINLQSLAGNKVAVIEWVYHFRNHFVDRMVWFKGQGQPSPKKTTILKTGNPMFYDELR